MDGVVRTRVGYAGGTLADPTYRRLGDHSETIEVDYDPSVITYADLLDAFWTNHDARRAPFSTQYRSAVFYRTEEELAQAEASRSRIEGVHGRVSTAIEPLDRFYRAEAYHQKFYWKQFASEVERSAAGQVPDWRSPEFIAWASERGILESAAGKNAGKESVPAG